MQMCPLVESVIVRRSIERNLKRGIQDLFLEDSGNFPRSLGILRKVLADAHNTTRFGKNIIDFWRKEKDGEGGFYA